MRILKNTFPKQNTIIGWYKNVVGLLFIVYYSHILQTTGKIYDRYYKETQFPQLNMEFRNTITLGWFSVNKILSMKNIVNLHCAGMFKDILNFYIKILLLQDLWIVSICDIRHIDDGGTNSCTYKHIKL